MLQPKQEDRILLFFGSFNPVHLGHIWVAQKAIEYINLKSCWFVLSPQNPFKDPKEILPFEQRFELLEEAKKEFPFIKPCEIEKNLPKPQYTSNTIRILKEKYPQKTFLLLIGSDCYLELHLWKEYLYILENTTLVIYPRKTNLMSNKNINETKYKSLFLQDMPLYNISSSWIRGELKNKNSIRPFLPKNVFQKMFHVKHLNS